MGVTKTCKQCGKEFKVYPSEKDRKFCSSKCYYKWLKGENNPAKRPEVRKKISETRKKGDPKIIKICKQCGEKFKVILSKKDRKFCSRECYNKWHRGENHPMYGKTGKKAPRYGEHHTEEARRKIAESKKGDKNPAKRPEVREKISKGLKEYYEENEPWNKGLTKEDSEKIAKIGKKVTKFRKGKTWEEIYGEKGARIKRERMSGETSPSKREEVKEKIRKTINKKIDKIIRPPLKSSPPTEPEKRIISIVDKYSLPLKYIGDGREEVNNLYPDFRHKDKNEKKLIEVNGTYWHTRKRNLTKKEAEVRRRKQFSDYKILFLWTDEMRDMTDREIADKIKVFLKK